MKPATGGSDVARSHDPLLLLQVSKMPNELLNQMPLVRKFAMSMSCSRGLLFEVLALKLITWQGKKQPGPR